MAETFEEFYDSVNRVIKQTKDVAEGKPVEDELIIIGQAEDAVAEDIEHVAEHIIPEGVEPVDMTEELVNTVIERLEVQGFDEGVDFLVMEDGKILANDRCPKSQLVSEGLRIGDLF